MPEDGVGFLFWKTEDDRNIANDKAVRNASEHLKWEDDFAPGGYYTALDHIGRAVEAVQKNIDPPRGSDPQWEDNVPPDFSDSSDFLL